MNEAENSQEPQKLGFDDAVRPHLVSFSVREQTEDAIRVATHCEDAAIRSFLDSRWGWEFGEALVREIGDGSSVEQAIGSSVEEWMSRKPDPENPLEAQVPPNLPYLSGLVEVMGMARGSG